MAAIGKYVQKKNACEINSVENVKIFSNATSSKLLNW